MSETGTSGRVTVLDFQQVRFVDSTVLGAIVAAAKRASAAGGQVLLTNVTGLAGKVLAMTGLLHILDVYGSNGRLDRRFHTLLHPAGRGQLSGAVTRATWFLSGEGRNVQPGRRHSPTHRVPMSPISALGC